MDTTTDNEIAGVFHTSAQAEAAVAGLRQLGLTEHDVEMGTPEAGRYRLENRESEDLGHGIIIGIAVGIPAGALVSIGLFLVTVPDVANAGTAGVILSALIGAFWGVFFGGLGGMVPKALAHAEGDHWYTFSENGSETVIVAHAGELVGAARKVMRRNGARAFLDEIPATHPVGATAVLA